MSLPAHVFSGVASSCLLSGHVILSVGFPGLSSGKRMEMLLFGTRTPSALLLWKELRPGPPWCGGRAVNALWGPGGVRELEGYHCCLYRLLI